MEQQGISPIGSHCFSLLFSACTYQGQVDIGRQLHAHLLASKGSLDDFLAASLISMYSKCGYLEEFCQAFAEISKCQEEGSKTASGEPLLGVGAWTAMIKALATY